MLKLLKTHYIFILLSALFLLTRLWSLGYDMSNSDSLRWHNRSEDFLQALKTGDLKATYQRYHPGVTLMWVNAVVKQLGFSIQTLYTDTPKTLENAEWFPIIHGWSKGANVFIYFLLVSFNVYLIARLFNKTTALYYMFFITVEPYFIGINRWFHLTSFEVLFSFTALLCILYWSQSKSRKFYYLSALFMALGVLSKTTTLLAGPVIAGVIIYKAITTKTYLDIVRYPLVLVGLVFALFPAMWVDPVYVLTRLANSFEGSVVENIRNEQLLPWIRPLYYGVILGIKLSPVVLLLFVLRLVTKVKKNSTELLIVAYWAVFVVALSFSQQKIDRYALALFTPMLLLAARQAAELPLIKQKIVVALSCGLLIFATYTYFPLYSSYANPLIGGIKTSLNLRVYENSGENYADAAFYLKQFGRGVKVYVPNNVDSFKPFYNGSITQEIVPGINYEVQSLDIDRLEPESFVCHKLVTSFGPRFGPDLVFVYACE